MKHKQNGFSVLEILLIIVIVGALAGVGLVVFRANNAANNSLNSAEDAGSSSVSKTEKSGQATPSPTEASSDTSVFKIPEIGLQITMPKELNDLIYSIDKQTDPRGKEVIYAYLSTTSLSQKDGCDAKGGTLGVIAKGIGGEPSADDLESAHYYGATILKTDAAFYTYQKSQAICYTAKTEGAEYEATADLRRQQLDLLKTSVTSAALSN